MRAHQAESESIRGERRMADKEPAEEEIGDSEPNGLSPDCAYWKTLYVLISIHPTARKQIR